MCAAALTINYFSPRHALGEPTLCLHPKYITCYYHPHHRRIFHLHDATTPSTVHK